MTDIQTFNNRKNMEVTGECKFIMHAPIFIRLCVFEFIRLSDGMVTST